jgi:hypothetical protein
VDGKPGKEATIDTSSYSLSVTHSFSSTTSEARVEQNESQNLLHCSRDAFSPGSKWGEDNSPKPKCYLLGAMKKRVRGREKSGKGAHARPGSLNYSL